MAVKTRATPLNLMTAECLLIGDAPLIYRRFRWVEYHGCFGPPHIRDPGAEYEAAFHRLPDGRPGIPAGAFLSAIREAKRYLDGKWHNRDVRILGDPDSPDLVPVDGTPQPHVTTVRAPWNRRHLDYIYSAEWPQWEACIRVQFDADALTLEHLHKHLVWVGQCPGIGLPGGGQFHVEGWRL